MPAGRPILVTGSHRSGTTWVGKMLALAPRVGYVHEPFNPGTAPGISAAPFDHFFTYVTPANEARYLPALERTLRFDYDWRAQLAATRSPRDAYRALRDGLAFTRARLEHARPLMKDPIALLSAEWLAERFAMDVVVVIRHPAAFVSSIKRLHWDHQFRSWLDDEQLMRDHMAPFAGEVAEQARERRDIVEQGALLWRILYSIVDGYRARHPEWTFVRHEDLSLDPVPEFARLYERLGLRLTPRARAAIEQQSAASNPAQARSAHDIRVNSRANVASWRSRLSADEIEAIRTAVADVSPRFYDPDEW